VYNHGPGLIEPVPTCPFSGKLFWYELLVAAS
jgi:hypothetical protein